MIRIARSDQLASSDWEALTELCEAAFNESWDGYWESIGPGIHMIVQEPDGGAVAHAALVDRPLYLESATLRGGYVEAVAVWPHLQGTGLGTLVMTEIDRLIDDSYELGALSTGRHAFYERLGWIRWRGPTWIRHPDGRRERSADEDDGIMVRLTPSTPGGVSPGQTIAVDWRPGDVW